MTERVPEVQPRSYQMEMLMASLNENVIVAMGTGTGKTQIAILRILNELEKPNSKKLIWFLAPTVGLCQQQFDAISKRLPPVGIKKLIGSDGVDRWTDKDVWDAALSGIRVVVSTPAILCDALSHGYIKMDQIALLIFDEAHNCTGKSPTNRIMRDFYHYTKSNWGASSVPHILGLTASPIIRSSLDDVRTIESNLDAAIRTPHATIDELKRHAFRPSLERRTVYGDNLDELNRFTKLPQLESLYGIMRANYGIEDLSIQQRDAPKKQEPKCLVTLRRFCGNVEHIQEELGSQAAEIYLHLSIRTYKDGMRTNGERFSRVASLQKDPLMNIICHPDLIAASSSAHATEITDVSSKAENLLDFLRKAHSPQFRGLIFVQQRCTAEMLRRLLNHHPSTKEVFNCGTFVGMSSHVQSKTNLGDIMDSKQQMMTLENFRKGKINLMIATNALEEGIDVPACNTVICFNPPQNIKSFIQRRGRARMSESRYIIILKETDKFAKIEWDMLESEMDKIYQERMRALNDAIAEEAIQETPSVKYRVDTTGALVTMDDALAKLHHFYDKLPDHASSPLQPIFTFNKHPKTGEYQGHIILPNCIAPSISHIIGSGRWENKNNAKKDAAVQVFKTLHEYKIINDHLLPLEFETDESQKAPSSLVKISEQYCPWNEIIGPWTSGRILHQKLIIIEGAAKERLEAIFVLPQQIRDFENFEILRDNKSPIRIQLLDHDRHAEELSPKMVNLFRKSTEAILRPLFSPSVPDQKMNFSVLFAPNFSPKKLSSWINQMDEFNITHNKTVTQTQDQKESPNYVNVTKPDHIQHANGNGWHSTWESFAKIDKCAHMMLHIVQQMEIHLVAHEWRTRLLPAVSFTSIDLVATALCTPDVCNYSAPLNEQLQFLGSTLLNFFVSRQIFVNHAYWHKGYLEKQKNLILSNGRLAKSAKETGLDQFIVTHCYSEYDWSSIHITEQKESDKKKFRMMSVKTLAGVVEAMIGAAYLEGGYEKAVSCACLFLHEIKKWSTTALMDGSYATTRPKDVSAAYFAGLESALGYTFQDQSLLIEAMTYPSHVGPDSSSSYSRLTFLGDEIIGMVIVHILFKEDSPPPIYTMRLLKVATTNAMFLAFLCMEFTVSQNKTNINPDRSITPQTETVPLCNFIRLCNEIAINSRNASMGRYRESSLSIRQAFVEGKDYPWQKLAHLNAEKSFSDIMKSLFGAVYIDSQGDLGKCIKLAETLRLLPYLRQMIKNKSALIHPKSCLAEMVAPNKVNYCVEHDCPPDTERQEWCYVTVAGKEIARVSTCPTKEETEIKVAEEAIANIEHTQNI